MVKAVLFDMDGILFDSERLYMEADRTAAAELGLEMPDALLHQMCGVTTKRTMEIISAHFGPGFDCDAYMARAKAILKEYIAEGRVAKKPGVDETLAFLDANGIKKAIASSANGKSVARMLAATGLSGAFPVIVSGDMVAKSKPEPDIFLAAAAALGVPAADCAAIEDSYHGVRAAAAAGCATVMIPDVLPPTDEIRALCAAVLPTMADLPAWLAAH